jgi:N-acetylneuraminate synthase
MLKKLNNKKNCFIVAEIGINHNGSVDIAKDLIDVAKESGCDAVKFQKRTVDIVYSPEELSRLRHSPFGSTNGDLKRGLEFGFDEYYQIEDYCNNKGILWFASCWDEESVDFINQFNVPCYKIASASLTDDNLLRHAASKGKPIFLSTGMSRAEEIDHAISVLGDSCALLYHCTSTYPTALNELNLNVIKSLKDIYGMLTGFSGHTESIIAPVMAAMLGADSVEVHITLDKNMWGLIFLGNWYSPTRKIPDNAVLQIV